MTLFSFTYPHLAYPCFNHCPYFSLCFLYCYQGFHNSLGECYRTLGRIREAQHQFQIALALNADYLAPVFNLGLTYQQTNEWEKAIVQYRIVTAVTNDKERNKTASIASVTDRIKGDYFPIVLAN